LYRGVIGLCTLQTATTALHRGLARASIFTVSKRLAYPVIVHISRAYRSPEHSVHGFVMDPDGLAALAGISALPSPAEPLSRASRGSGVIAHARPSQPKSFDTSPGFFAMFSGLRNRAIRTCALRVFPVCMLTFTWADTCDGGYGHSRPPNLPEALQSSFFGI
jgi:hypothetical protein